MTKKIKNTKYFMLTYDEIDMYKERNKCSFNKAWNHLIENNSAVEKILDVPWNSRVILVFKGNKIPPCMWGLAIRRMYKKTVIKYKDISILYV